MLSFPLFMGPEKGMRDTCLRAEAPDRKWFRDERR
jgi:hypothetical protein